MRADVVLSALTKAHKRRRAVAEAPGERHCEHRERKHHGGGGVAEIAHVAVANKYLIHDIVKRADKQRKNAGYGKLSEKFTYIVVCKINRFFFCMCQHSIASVRIKKYTYTQSYQ